MKHIILFLVFVSISTVLFAQVDFLYSEKGEKEYLKIRKDKMIIKTKSPEDAKALVKETVFYSAYDIYDNMVIATIDTLQTKLDGLNKKLDVFDVAYALEYKDGVLHYPSYRMFVKFKKGQSSAKVLDNIGLTKSIKAIELFNPYSEIYKITLDVKLEQIMQICRSLYESGCCVFAEPSFIREMKPYNTYYPQQWGLNNTTQSGGTRGVDIKAESAWRITRGSNAIRVAVIDEGVDLMHPDLQENLLPGFDAVPANRNPGGADGSPFNNNVHGTACAGIIGAVDNGIGIVGVTPNVRIIPIRIAYKDIGDTHWTTNDEWIAEGIRHAWETAQTDVISNSWGGGIPSLTVTNAINNAVTNGRGGRGCVVVFASGNNYDSSVSYPASLDDVIAVGAIDHNGQRPLFSNYGSKLDVVAPGVDIFTTGMLGATGYGIVNDGTNGVYFSNFTGTSAACPHVAGIAALILSVRPDFGQWQVRQAIESNCWKIQSSGIIPYIYSTHPDHPNGTWNGQVGYGLVNAYATLYSVAPRISGPISICGSLTADYSITNLPVGTTASQVIWTCSSNLSLQGGNTGLTKRVSITGGGNGWIRAQIGTINITLETNIALPPFPEETSHGMQSVYCGSTVYMDPVNAPGVNSYRWELVYGPGRYDLRSASGLYGLWAQGAFYANGYWVVQAYAITACGESPQPTHTYAFQTNYCSSYSVGYAYPNPASNILTVNIDEMVTQAESLKQTVTSDKRLKIEPDYDIRLYDGQGNLLRQRKVKSGTAEFRVADLPSGVYHLHIYDGTSEKPVMQQIVVEH